MGWHKRRKIIVALSSVAIAVTTIASAQQIKAFIDWIRVGSAFNSGVVAALNDEDEFAVKHFTTTLDLDPSFVLAYEKRGAAYLELGEYDVAIADYKYVLQEGQETAEVYLRLGDAYFNLEDHTKAIAHYSKALTSNPELTEAYVGRGITHYKQQDYWKALEDFNQALDIDSKLANAYWGRGLVYAHLIGPDKAKEDYLQALALGEDLTASHLAPDHELAYLGLAFARYEQGDKAGAISDLEKALQLNPEYPESYYIFRGNIYIEQEKYQLALEDQEQALRYIDPNRAGIGVLLVLDEETWTVRVTHAIEGTSAKLQGLQVDDQILAVDGQSIADMSLVSVFEQLAGNLNTSVQLKIYRESQGEFEIQLTRHSQYLLATAFASRALAHYGLDNPQQAFSDCNQAKQIDPTNAFAYQFCGAIHQSSGNSQAAIADYQRALTLFTEQGDDASVERVKTLLEQLSSQQLEP